MLATEDIENLFASMRTAYGNQWKHGQDAVRVWRNALSRFPVEQLRQAMNQSLEAYTNHPPTLPQFLALCKPRQVPNTYLPAPKVSPATVAGNKILFTVLRNQGGVDSSCLRNLVALKRALIEDHNGLLSEALIDDLETQLTELAENHDRKAKTAEQQQAHRRFCRRQGIPAQDAAA